MPIYKHASLNWDQRLELQKWADSQNPRPSLKVASDWITQQWKVVIPHYSISRYLDKKKNPASLTYAHERSAQKKAKRLRIGQWPVLEQLLYTWQLGLETQGIGSSIELLQEKARDIWLKYPEARNNKPANEEACPAFGKKWCALFRERFHIRNRGFHGEASAAPKDDEYVRDEMEKIRRAVLGVPKGNRYNMDETGLYWRRTASFGLAAEVRPGVKKDKSRISLALTTNDTGDDFFEIWAIGRFKRPLALRGFNFDGAKVVWRNNKSSWMTGLIMKEWLRSFYAYIARKKPGEPVLLLLDNFSAHELAVKLSPPPENITIMFFPSNVTSLYQPMDQGVINTFKSYYRRHFLKWMCQEFTEPATDASAQLPLSSMNLRLALKWISQVWFGEMKTSIVRNCWIRSTVLGLDEVNDNVTVEMPHDVEELFKEVNYYIPVRDRMSLENFLNPADENEVPAEPKDAEQVLQAVIDEWQEQQDQEKPAEEDDDGGVYKPVSTLTSKEAVRYINGLLDWGLEKECIGSEDIQALRRLKQRVERWQYNNKTQATLQQIWGRNSM